MANESTSLKGKSKGWFGGSGGKKGKSITTSLDFWIILLVPAIVFNIISVLYNFAFYAHWHWVITITIVGLLFCVVLIMLRSSNTRYLPLGVSCGASIVLGAFLGLYCYDTFGIFAQFYKHSRTYTNVVPSEPAASVADAGRLTFTEESHVKGPKSVGYAAPNGNRYCVAPIGDSTDQQRIEFWAVGVNCCGWEADFSCDASQDETAHGGIVVFDNMGLFNPSNRDYYVMARKKAEAEFDLTSVEKPMYVRWVNDLDKLANSYSTSANSFLGVTVVADLIVSAVFSYVFVKNMPAGQLPS